MSEKAGASVGKPAAPAKARTADVADRAQEPPSKAKRIGMIIGAAVAAIGASYGVGWFQRADQVAAAEQRAAELEKQKVVASGEFDAQRDRAIRLEARRRLHLALTALDEKNYGIAQGHLDKAVILLERAKGGNIDALTSEIKSTKLDPGADPAATKSRVQGLINRFDSLLPPPEP